MDRPVARRSLLALAGGLLLEGCAAGSPAQAASRKSGSDAPAAARPVATKRASGASHSGLPWMSGITGSVLTRDAADEIDALESFRGRKMDVQTTFANWHLGWDKWVKAQFWRAGLPQLLADRGIRVAHSTPLLCGGSEGQFAEAARGDFDEYHRTVAKRWKDLGHPTPIIRLGWETTLNHFPWNALRDETPGYGKYKDAFRRVADIYRHELPGCEIDWNNLRRPQVDARRVYPGDDWVDIIGADLYGNRPRAVVSDTDWDAFANNVENDGPSGPIPFIQFAISRKKKFSVAEWAVTNVDNDPESPYDSGRYVRGMWEFFNAFAEHLSYECYFNRKGENGDHRIYPSDFNPRASAAYKKAWQP